MALQEAEPLDRAMLRVVAVSAARGEGLAELRGALGRCSAQRRAARTPRRSATCVMRRALGRAGEALTRAREIAGREPGEILALELRECLAAIGEVTGRTVGEDVLERIFSRFCVGK